MSRRARRTSTTWGNTEYRAAWEVPDCAWDLLLYDATDPGYARVRLPSAEVVVGNWMTCGGFDFSAWADGVYVDLVDYSTWALLGDADGDGVLAENGDCDDADPTRSGCADDVAGDGVDQDCDGDDTNDDDGDGYDDVYAGGDDCDDSDPDIHPGATDIVDDRIDQDCDGGDDEDGDNDGWDADDDCDDGNRFIHPGAEEIPYDRIDQDCRDGDLANLDGDGWAVGEDCDDTDADVHPRADENPCDGVDSDCDGTVEDCSRPEERPPGEEPAAEPPDAADAGCAGCGGGSAWMFALPLAMALRPRRSASRG